MSKTLELTTHNTSFKVDDTGETITFAAERAEWPGLAMVAR